MDAPALSDADDDEVNIILSHEGKFPRPTVSALIATFDGESSETKYVLAPIKKPSSELVFMSILTSPESAWFLQLPVSMLKLPWEPVGSKQEPPARLTIISLPDEDTGTKPRCRVPFAIAVQPEKLPPNDAPGTAGKEPGISTGRLNLKEIVDPKVKAPPGEPEDVVNETERVPGSLPETIEEKVAVAMLMEVFGE
jgi:hypothetical protein